MEKFDVSAGDQDTVIEAVQPKPDMAEDGVVSLFHVHGVSIVVHIIWRKR